jgi:histidine triad (HIT) family protein
MDVMPQIDGHTLVVPKCDAQDLLDVDPQVLAETIKTVQRLAVAVKAAFAAPGVMVAQLNGPAAGQTVFHLHFHIMPRHDGIALGMHAREMQDPGILEQHAQRIREQLATHE